MARPQLKILTRRESLGTVTTYRHPDGNNDRRGDAPAWTGLVDEGEDRARNSRRSDSLW